MSGYMLKAVTKNGQARVYVTDAKDVVNEAIKRHSLSPVAAVALGRLLIGGLMMGAMCKNDTDSVTVRINGDGPIEQLLVQANPKGEIKGYVKNPDVVLPLKDGRIDVAGALGIGVLSVTKDMGLKEPYVGDCILISSEIGDDLTYYFATSEQTPSAVGLGVTLGSDGYATAAGGFIIQMMPDADEETTGIIEANIAPIKSISELLLNGKTADDILDIVLKGLDYKILDKMPVNFKCDCSRSKVERALISLGKDEVQSLIDEDKPVDVTCQFCGEKYEFSLKDLEVIRDGLKARQSRGTETVKEDPDGN